MSWLYAQTWLWYLIAFVVGVLLAWLFLVLPQQRRLRTLRSVAGTAVDHDLYAESRAAVAGAGAASGATLFDSTAAERAATGDGDPATDQFQAVDAAPGDSSDTTELTVPPAPDDTATGEIPAVPPAAAEADSANGNSTGAAADAAETPTPPTDTAEIDDSAAESNGRVPAAALGAGAAGFVPARDGADAADEPASTETAGADQAPVEAAAGTTTADTATADPATADSAPSDSVTVDAAATGTTTADAATADATTVDATDRPADDTAADATSDAATSDPEASPAEASTPTQPAEAPDPAANGDAAADGAHAGVQGLLAAPVAVAAGPYQGSALAGPEGAAPGAEYTIKGNEDSMLFHTPDSPYYGRTKAEVWFRDPADAEAAGFTSWTRNK